MQLATWTNLYCNLIISIIINSCIEQIDIPMYVYEVVMRSITMAAGRDDKERELVSRLLSLGYGKIFSTFSITRGFQKLFTRLSDLLLDCPEMEEV